MLNDLLYKYHTLTSHANFKILKEKFYKNKIGFFGLDTILLNYIKNCVDCAKMKIIEKSKREKTITILSHGPRDRYVADL